MQGSIGVPRDANDVSHARMATEIRSPATNIKHLSFSSVGSSRVVLVSWAQMSEMSESPLHGLAADGADAWRRSPGAVSLHMEESLQSPLDTSLLSRPVLPLPKPARNIDRHSHTLTPSSWSDRVMRHL
jgi:hypothetical protein